MIYGWDVRLTDFFQGLPLNRRNLFTSTSPFLLRQPIHLFMASYHLLLSDSPCLCAMCGLLSLSSSPLSFSLFISPIPTTGSSVFIAIHCVPSLRSTARFDLPVWLSQLIRCPVLNSPRCVSLCLSLSVSLCINLPLLLPFSPSPSPSLPLPPSLPLCFCL